MELCSEAELGALGSQLLSQVGPLLWLMSRSVVGLGTRPGMATSEEA